MSRKQSDIGLVGLAVMGQNLALNIADHGYKVSVYNRTTRVTEDFLARVRAHEPAAPRLGGHSDIAGFVRSIRRPRRIVLLVKAGFATDATIETLLPHLERSDLIVDGGNAYWEDTVRREEHLAAHGVLMIGSGVSGGELGARFGPSLMPGGSRRAWRRLAPVWEAIAAKVDPRSGKPIERYAPGQPVREGEPCAAYIGAGGAGHYVKMVHNGIEYIDMQLISEAYFLMRRLLGLEPDALADIFSRWNRGVLDSFLVGITAEILRQRDPDDEREFLVDRILDTAAQKGTGKWTASSALDLGVPASAMAEAVFARYLSALKDQRVTASGRLRGPRIRRPREKQAMIAAVQDALYCSKICAYAQGFSLMAAAAAAHEWKLEFGQIAQIWRGGCIIRARFLQKITDAYQRDPTLQNLLLDPFFRGQIHRRQSGWRHTVTLAAQNGVPVPAFMSALGYFDGYRTSVLPAALVQAQRDFFGAHGYQRTDAPRGQLFHLDWPAPGRPQHRL